MNIEIQHIKVADLVDGYEDRDLEGVVGYGGRLNIRPPYQREFVYKEKQRDEVIHTVRKGFPLNTMYWAVAGDGFELMDGQQRTASLCRYVAGDFSVLMDGSPMAFHNLTAERQRAILDYELSVYVCDGEDGEKLDWFRIINIAGEKLTEQELRNAIYTGPWLADAKRWFSKPGCPAASVGDKYVTGSPIRQQLLETALEWIEGGDPKAYMGAHQQDADAQELWQHYQAVISWVQRTFPKYRALMKGLDWGGFYRDHGHERLNAATLETEIARLILDDEVEAKKGIYAYLLTDNEKTLSLRAFDDKTRAAAYERQEGVCPVCKKTYALGEMEADHIVPWSKGGKTVPDNCQMLCMRDNRTKGGR